MILRNRKEEDKKRGKDEGEIGFGRNKSRNKFRRALRKEDQQVFDQLFEKGRLHAEAGRSASRPWPFETVLISMLLEWEKALVELEMKIGVRGVYQFGGNNQGKTWEGDFKEWEIERKSVTGW